jgi:hypothetical protein
MELTLANLTNPTRECIQQYQRPIDIKINSPSI